MRSFNYIVAFRHGQHFLYGYLRVLGFIDMVTPYIWNALPRSKCWHTRWSPFDRRKLIIRNLCDGNNVLPCGASSPEGVGDDNVPLAVLCAELQLDIYAPEQARLSARTCLDWTLKSVSTRLLKATIFSLGSITKQWTIVKNITAKFKAGRSTGNSSNRINEWTCGYYHIVHEVGWQERNNYFMQIHRPKFLTLEQEPRTNSQQCPPSSK